MPAEKPIKIMLSSTVYNYDHVVEAIYNQLVGYGYQVLCSHKGTVYPIPGKTTEESCLAAVEECDFFFGVIFPNYGSSGYTHKEFLKAIDLNKPRGFLSHAFVPFTRTLLKNFMYDKDKNRLDFELPKKTMVMDSLKVIDMYNDAIGDNNPNNHRLWAQQFYKYELDGSTFVQTQFGDYARLANDLKQLKDGK